MPMLSFLSWTTISERLRVGRYELVTYGEAVRAQEIPVTLADSTKAVLEAYGHPRPVDQRSVPLLHQHGVGLVDDLSPEQITDYFEFQTRLTFAVLAARQFFSHRYANSDNTRLVIQGFSQEHAGGTVIQTRRRDGSTDVIIPKGNLKVRRPHHVSGWCELPRNLDVALLTALEEAAVRNSPSWPAMAEAIRLFVGANSDSPDVDMHAELIDVVSAFSRLAGEWKEEPTVEAFVRALPSARDWDKKYFGPKAEAVQVQKELGKGRSLRAIWLADAYRLRSQFGHGRVAAPPYPAVWTDREHLLLAGIAFPLYVKALLREQGLYAFSPDDELMNDAFDALATLAPFAVAPEDEGDEGDEENDENEEDEEHEEHQSSWSRIMLRAHSRQLTRWIASALDQEDPAAQTGDETDSPSPRQSPRPRSNEA